MKICSAAALFAVACLSAPSALADPSAETQIRDARKQYDAAIARRDFGALSALTTPQVQVTGPVLRITGLPDLQAALHRLVERRPDLSLTYEVDLIEVVEVWSVASERGHWRETWTEKGIPVDLRGSYLAMWKRVDGKWVLDAYLFVPQTCKGDTYCKAK
jgi:ketosteroid isomerase-like protein